MAVVPRIARYALNAFTMLLLMLWTSLPGGMLIDLGARGESYSSIVSTSQIPPAAAATFRESHPDAMIDRIERIVSNAPMIYRFFYRENVSPRSTYCHEDLR